MGKKKPIVTPFGQWEYPGEVTIIPSNNITMQGVNYPVLGIDNLGNQELMMPGMNYTFPGDYVTEIPQMGKGGLTQWFAEEWTDIKTGKPCGRSGKDKEGRPYPACRPKKRVNETTPKTTSEMSSAEKAKFKREKTSGKRIDYNHKRREEGGEIGWLDNYQKGGETSTEQNPTRIAPVDIRVKRKKVSDSNRYMYDTEGNLVYNPSLTIYPEIAMGSTQGETTFQPNIPVNLLNPTLEELVNVAAPYYPIDNRLTSGDRINLPTSNFQRSLEQDYILPQMVGRSFGNLPLNKGNSIDDGYGPNRRWTTNLNENPGNYFLNSPETYAYILKGDKSSLVDFDKKRQVESGMSNLDQRFDKALATQGYNIEMVDDYTANRPDQIWNRAEQARVEMLNNPEIREWARLHNLDLSNKYRSKYDKNNKNIKPTETDDDFASKIPESIYANRLAQAGLPTSRPDYNYGDKKTFIIQDPSKFNLAGYFPIDQEMIDSVRQMGEYVNDSSANLKNIMAERMGVDPKKFDNGEYLIHYNRSPISEYTPGKKYGGWLNQYQEGGEKTPLENFERIEQVNIKSKQAPWYVRYPRMFGRAIDNKLSDFGHQYAQRISNATGGSEWYKQSNPFMNLALESMNAPQLATTYAVTGKVQTPSEAMDIQNPYGALATDILLDPFTVGAIGKGLVKGAPAAARYATTRTPLRNTFNLNPFAEKLKNPNKSYRVAGLDAAEDFFNTGVLRSINTNKPLVIESGFVLPPRYTSFPSFQKGYADLRYLPEKGGVVFETSVPTFRRGEVNPVTGNVIRGRHYAHRPIDMNTGKVIAQLPAESVKVFDAQPHWLKGYQEVKTPKSNFKSEIDWGKWNPDTPKYPELINEYNAIEKSTKELGTWMKNPDGSPFKGTPEQFVQQQSSYFKKAFGNSKLVNADGSPIIQYHGGRKNDGIFLTPQDKEYIRTDSYTGDQGIYFTPSKRRAIGYSKNTPENERQVYETYINMEKPYTGNIKGKYGPDKITNETYNNLTKGNYDGITPYSLFPYNRQTISFSPSQIKSAIGNVGFFDMTNPNIYKAVAPIGAGIGVGASQMNQKKYGGWLDEYQEGGETSTEQNPDRMQEIKIAATSPGVKTFANALFDGGKWLAKNFIKYHPGLRFTTKVLGTGLNYFKDEVFDKYRPIEYPDVLDAIIKLNNPSVEPLKDKKGNLSPSEEAWRKGLGFKDDFKYIKPASYKPSDSKDSDTEYVRFENMYDPQKLINAYVKAQKKLEPGETKVLIESLDPYIKGRKNLEASGVAFSQQDPLQNFTLDKGEDEKGKYISLYDVYDFGPLITDLVYGFKKPYEVYDRFYYEKNKQGIPVYKKKKYGGWLDSYQDGGKINSLEKYK